MRRHTLLIALLLLALVAPTTFAADDSWLDQSPDLQWNAPGAALPVAPMVDPAFLDPRAVQRERPPETAEDEALVAHGWRLFTTYEAGWGVKLVYAGAMYDGMGRPLQYQAFVFVDGLFAGTLSPELMDSRSDGALGEAFLSGPDGMIATFRRYTATDPLCCPSGQSTVQYRVDRTPDGPVVWRVG